MSQREFITTTSEPMRVLGLRVMAPNHPEIPPLVGPLFDRVVERLLAEGIDPTIGVATYDARPDGSCEIMAGFIIEAGEVDGLEVVNLPACEVVTTDHLGSMASIGQSWGALMARVEADGWRYAAPCREIYKISPLGDEDSWVTELQQPVSR